jgi:hypothetical protein
MSSTTPTAAVLGAAGSGQFAERTRDLYEQIEAYAKPPLLPIPSLDDPTALRELGAKPNALSRGALKTILPATGFPAFHRGLESKLEDVLRRVNTRGPHLFAPILSATLALSDDPRSPDPIGRAATLIFAARRLHDELRAGTLPPDEDRGHVLEMGQYPNLFGTSTIVEGGQPRIFKSAHLSQITVVVGQRLFTLEIGDPGTDPTVEQIRAALEAIVRTARENPLGADEPAPGMLTAADHGTQLRIFSNLQTDAVNAESLGAVRHSLVTLCLDLDSHPGSYGEAARLAHSGNPANRWYHASLQLVVFGDAKAAAICSFSAYIDGNTMTRAGMELQQRAAACPLDGEAVGTPLPPARALRWQIPPAAAEQAAADFARVRDEQQATFDLDGLGQEFFAAAGLPPIHAFTLALQMTARRFVGKPVDVFQFLTMSRYRCKDLVQALVTTPETIRFLEHLDGADTRPEAARALMQEALKSQEQKCRDKRSRLALNESFALYLASLRQQGRGARAATAGISLHLLRKMGVLQSRPSEIVISHPKVYREVPVLGRPGVRLPYVKHFGLHYQIFEEKTVVTMMPGVTWQVANRELIDELRGNLLRLQQLARGSTPAATA